MPSAAGAGGISVEVELAAVDDGWVRTRDVARIDQCGLGHLSGRTSDVIITGGCKVPKRIEVAKSIPVSGVGEVLRRALRDALRGGAERPGTRQSR